ncbi:MAG: hypothetical protein LQ346_004673 [Caloplaca aetnensis]|nr:MAG: hypothetical protein LQ346_004673 [Caloplaca aetnensis]
MPVPVNALARNARPIKHKTKLASNPAELLACNEDLAAENQCKDLWIGPFFNGFVMGALEVWSGHHHLLIKPKDVWFAILTQLGPYIDKHGQGAAQLYVSHEGRRELEPTRPVANNLMMGVM